MWAKSHVYEGHLVNKTANIYRDRKSNEIVVVQDNKEKFRKPYERKSLMKENI